METLRALHLLARSFRPGTDPDNLNQVDPELMREVVPLVDQVLGTYFRVRIEGMDRVPRGRAILVGNHNAGITFLEVLAMGARWYLERGMDDPIYGLVHDAILSVPGLKNFLVRAGGIRASQANAEAVLRKDRKVFVAPGGNLDAFRPYRQRHRVKLGGRTGFIRLALKTGAPLCPVVFVGGHESFFVLHDGQPIVRLLHLHERFRLDTWPIFIGLPWGIAAGPLFHFPLPARSDVRFLPPVSVDEYGPEEARNPRVLRELHDRVVDSMQEAMNELAAGRRFPILG